MPLLSLSRVGMHFDGPHLFRDVTLELERGQKIGVIGSNGSGKSTLLKIIAGEVVSTEGARFCRRGLRLAYQAQELIVSPDRTVREELTAIFAADLDREVRLRELEHALGACRDEVEQRRMLREYEDLQHAHEAGRGYDVEQRIASTLSGLGLPEEAWDQPVDSFSGGERNIIGLARIILSDPEVILLDEPSNHLDMDSLEWFIRWMRASSATIVMVSHDRHLLDIAVETIWELGACAVTSWSGNYSDYRQQKEDALALQERQFKVQQKTIERLRFQARRLRDMASAYDDPGQAKRAQSILKRIERMDLVEKPRDSERAFRASLNQASRHGRIALSIHDYSFAYGERALFDGASLEIEYGQRICLVGPNGCGKSTLMREILHHGHWENPVLRLGKSVKIGDYSQIHQEVMDAETPLIDWLMERTGLLSQEAAALLHRFLFRRDDLRRRIGTLSGGEKSRLQLARLVHEKVNFLMLDEPTNHLDIPGCEQLESMLEEFDGTLLLISHDRYFLDRLVEEVVEVRDRQLVPFVGSYAAWWRMRHEEGAARQTGALALHKRRESAARPKSDNRLQHEALKAMQRDRRRLERQVADAEEHIGVLERRRDTVNRELERIYSEAGDDAQARTLAQELRQLEEALPDANHRWEQLAEQLEEERRQNPL